MSKRGISLFELLVVMGMSSVVLTVGVGMVHRVMHEQRFANRDNAMHRVAERLSARLRADVHLANRAELIQPRNEGEQGLLLNYPGEQIVTYTVRDNVLERSSILGNGPTHRDSFQFPDNYRLEFVDVLSQRVAFTAFATPQAYLAKRSREQQLQSGEVEIDRDVRRAVMHVEACVGRDHRFLAPTRKPKER